MHARRLQLCVKYGSGYRGTMNSLVPISKHIVSKLEEELHE
jgi:hypothetical protein